MKIDPAVLGALITAGIAAIVAPTFSWFIARLDGDAVGAQRTDHQIKRLDLVNKLWELRKSIGIADDAKWNADVRAELLDVLSCIGRARAAATPSDKVVLSQSQPRGRIRQFFLFYLPSSTGGWLGRIVFYFFLFCTLPMTVVPFLPRALLGPENDMPRPALVAGALFLVAFYGGLAAVFRMLAVRSDRRHGDVGTPMA